MGCPGMPPSSLKPTFSCSYMGSPGTLLRVLVLHPWRLRCRVKSWQLFHTSACIVKAKASWRPELFKKKKSKKKKIKLPLLLSVEGFGWRGPQKDSNQGNQERGPFFLLVIAAAGADVTPEEVAVVSRKLPRASSISCAPLRQSYSTFLVLNFFFP